MKIGSLLIHLRDKDKQQLGCLLEKQGDDYSKVFWYDTETVTVVHNSWVRQFMYEAEKQR